MLRSIKCTTITLVPKVISPTFFKEFSPKACSSTVYKLIAKIITAKLKTVVDYIVGPSQSAFMEGRNILENVIIAHDLVKCYTQKGVSLRGLINVDIRKAYVSVEWPFIKMILIEFGMPLKFVQLVMEYVRNVSYSLLINGGFSTKFQANKGLRLGDPMSPYLFMLVMEYLN
ncbi:secreted RxLR effector protein 78-like [Nicotiana tabacum]|uniref:Secreted RxLR effector protein 78-like n=1 Tax=Nicotiana tabacum TaxID=4097 RepID=A0AC58TXC5_TOBAC